MSSWYCVRENGRHGRIIIKGSCSLDITVGANRPNDATSWLHYVKTRGDGNQVCTMVTAHVF